MSERDLSKSVAVAKARQLDIDRLDTVMDAAQMDAAHIAELAAPLYGDDSAAPLAAAPNDKWDMLNRVFEASKQDPPEIKRMRQILMCVLLGLSALEVLVLLGCVVAALLRPPSEGFFALLRILIPSVFAEIIAMVFFIVKFVFRTNMDVVLSLMVEIVQSDKRDF